MYNKPLVITPGEPSGIGVEITLKAWKSGQTGVFFLLDDPDRVKERAKVIDLDLPLRIIGKPSEAKEYFSDALPVLPHYFSSTCVPGKPSVENANAVIKALDIAVDFVEQGYRPYSRIFLHRRGSGCAPCEAFRFLLHWSASILLPEYRFFD